MSSSSARARLLVVLVLVPLIAAAVGCSLIAGVDFSQAHDRLDEGGTGGEGGTSSDDGGGIVETPDATPTGCAADQKKCSGACVSKTDPAYGCAAGDCLPCSIAFATNATCKAGVCAADSCAAGHADCDGDPKNGCEASLSSPSSCGNCTTKCAAPSPLCAPTGCVSSCPGGLTECNGACIDTKMNLDNCGMCSRKCVAPANGDPVCLNSTCAFACRTGFGDCVDNPAKVCNPLAKWYRDQDGDGVGGAVSVQACTAPVGHVASSGDCLDTNNQVHPGQLAFFPTSFVNAAGAESYDYDCSGVEVEQSPEHWPGSCGPGCGALGNTPRSPGRPAAAGLNAYCGSTSYRECFTTGGQLARPQSMGARLIPGGCQAQLSTTTPVTCH